jgi:hypothetical protein
LRRSALPLEPAGGFAVIEVDLNARILTEGHNVYVARPGRDFRLFPEFRESGLLLLELPGLGWPFGQQLSDDDLRRLVNRSRALRRWHRVRTDDPKPSTDLHDYTTGGGQSRDLIPLIRKFSEKALGKAQTNEADLSSLKAKVDNSYLVANKIVERLPKAEPDFKTYAGSLIELQKCAERFQGALDAQCWVEAVSRYAAQKKAFEQKVTALQTSWP